MMDKEQVYQIVGQIDPALIEEMDAPPKRRLPKIVKAGLIAACLTLALAGTAFAAMESGLLMRFVKVKGEQEPVDAEHVRCAALVITERIPVDGFSQEVREMAARDAASPAPGYGFDSWEAAEDLLGLNVMDNPLLDSGDLNWTVFSEGEDKARGRCMLRLDADPGTGALRRAVVIGGYAQRASEEEEDHRVCSVNVLATLSTENDPYESAGGYLLLYTEEGVEQAVVERYTAPCGEVVTILRDNRSLHGPSAGLTAEGDAGDPAYVAYMRSGKALLQVYVSGLEGAEGLARLKSIMDGFQPVA